MTTPSPNFIVFTLDQFAVLVGVIISSAIGAVVWVYSQTHPLDKSLSNAKNDVENLKKRMDKVEDFMVDYKTDSLLSRAKKIWEQDRKEAKKKSE